LTIASEISESVCCGFVEGPFRSAYLDREEQRMKTILHRIFGLGTLVVATFLFVASNVSARQLTICKNTTFALCAASTCVDTGQTITGNDGTTHEASSCICPILTGNNIADLDGGNISNSSCVPPNPQINVYSTFQFNKSFPQKINGHWLPNVPAIPQVCPSSDSFTQCWNWACTKIAPRDGVQLAKCTCPIEQTDFSFITQAGVGHPAACGKLPVGAPLFFDPEEILTQP
jgi:hypothetical protein